MQRIFTTLALAMLGATGASAVEGDAPVPATLETRNATAGEAGRALALVVEADFTALCQAEAPIEDYLDVVAQRSSAADLDAIMLALAEVGADENLCANARAAARQAGALAQFAQAAASDDATGALGDDALDAPFAFGGLGPPGGAGYGGGG